jgi:hypothetical protein
VNHARYSVREQVLIPLFGLGSIRVTTAVPVDSIYLDHGLTIRKPEVGDLGADPVLRVTDQVKLPDVVDSMPMPDGCS